MHQKKAIRLEMSPGWRGSDVYEYRGHRRIGHGLKSWKDEGSQMRGRMEIKGGRSRCYKPQAYHLLTGTPRDQHGVSKLHAQRPMEKNVDDWCRLELFQWTDIACVKLETMTLAENKLGLPQIVACMIAFTLFAPGFAARGQDLPKTSFRQTTGRRPPNCNPVSI